MDNAITGFSDVGIEVTSAKSKQKLRCPKCSDQRTNKGDRSLYVDLKTGIYHCFYCGWKGCVHKDSQPIQRREPKKIYRKPQPIVYQNVGSKVQSYFEGRGITPETLDKLRITESTEYFPQIQKKARCICFNYYLEDSLINVKYRTSDKQFKLIPDAELIMYNLNSVVGEDYAIITEGEIDALTFAEAGFDSVVSVPNGASVNLSYLDDYIEDYFDDKTTIYIASDNDKKGLILQEELVRRFGNDRCKIIEYPKGCKDANEVLTKELRSSRNDHAKAVQAIRDLVTQARDVRVEGVISISDFDANLDKLYREGMPKGLPIGIPNFDKLLRFELGRLLVITGYPNSGKGEFIDEMCVRLNLMYGWKVGLFSPENHPIYLHTAKLISRITGKKFREYDEKDGLSLPLEEYEESKEYVKDNFFYVYPENASLDNILDKAKFLVKRRGIKIFILDPYNRIEDSPEHGESETKLINKQLSKIQKFAEAHNILFCLMAHPQKPMADKNGVLPPCTLYSISGSAHFKNKADYGIVVHRDFELKRTNVSVDKIRWRNVGELGVVTFLFNTVNARFVEFVENAMIKYDNENYLRRIKREKEQIDTQTHFDDDFELKSTN